MRQQRNMLQMKDQDKIPEEQPSEVETSNLPEKVQGNGCKNDKKKPGRKMNELSEKLEVSNKEKI